jgi:capsid protein
MTDFRAASETRLLGPVPWNMTPPTWDWSRDWLRIALRAQEMVANNPFAAAMVACKLDSTHGPDGLRPVSQAQYDTTRPVDKQDHALRQQLEAANVRAGGLCFDAGGQLTRRQFERQLDHLATVLGEGFAVRVEIPNRRGKPRTAWRLVRPERVSNPDDRPNDDRLYHGMEIDADGQPVALWVERTQVAAFTEWSDRTWDRVPWYAPDGTPNIVHRVGWRMPGMLRGISMLSPILVMAAQVGGVFEAHVTGKRGQACTPVIYYVDDPAAAAKAARADSSSIVGPHTKFNPFQVYYAKIGSTVDFKSMSFNGQDFDAFMGVAFRILCAVWQLPVEVVLCQMGEASLSSARAGLDQVDRTAQAWQTDHIEQASNLFEHGTVSELIRYHDLTPGTAGIDGLLLNRYRRPPKYSTDREKDANTIDQLIKDGVSPTTAFAMFGHDYEDETDQAVRDEVYKQEARKAAGLDQPKPVADQVDDDQADDEQAKDADDANVEATKDDADTTDARFVMREQATALQASLAIIDRLAAARPDTSTTDMVAVATAVADAVAKAPAPVVNVHAPRRGALRVERAADGSARVIPEDDQP